MTTTSANIAGVMVPLGMVRRDLWPYSKTKIYNMDSMKPKGKKKKKKPYSGMMYIDTSKYVNEGKKYTVPVGDGKWKVPSLGKVGVWRMAAGRRMFFPDDGSAPTPSIPSGKAKKGFLSKLAGLIGGLARGMSSKDVGMSNPAEKAKKASKPVKKAKKKKKMKGSKKLLQKVDEVMLKASRTKGGRKLAGPLKAMKAALEDGDEKAFRKAEASLAKASQKLAKRKG